MTNVFEEEWVVVLEDQVTGEKNIVWEDLTEEEARQEAHRLNEEKREECYYYASNYITFTRRVKPNKDGKPWYTHRGWRES